MDLNNLLSDFLEERETLGYRDKKGMKKQVKKLFAYLQELNYRLEDIGLKEAQDYQRWLKEGDYYCNGTIVNFIKGAIALYNYLKKAGKVSVNPFLEIKRIRAERRLPKNIPKEKEMIKILKKMEKYEDAKGQKRQKNKYKMHVISELMYSTSLRIGEIAELTVDSIDFERNLIKVEDVKTKEEKIVFLNDYAKEILMIYVNEMRPLILDGNCNMNYLFGCRAGRLIVLLNEELEKVTKELGYPKMTSHDFRHAVGYHFLRRGCNIRYIQEILGHKSIKTTEIYTKVDNEDLKEMFNRYHPRKWRKDKDK